MLLALHLRFFGTKRLAAVIVALVVVLLLLLITLPEILRLSLAFLAWVLRIFGTFAFYGLFAYVLPGIIIALVGLGISGIFIILVSRGYLNLAVRYHNWLRWNYYLAQQDVAQKTGPAASE